MEVEGQIRQLQQMLQQQKEAEEELVARIGKLQEEKRDLQDRLASFQRGLSGAEQEKRELERAHVRLEKDKKALRNTLDKVRLLKVELCVCVPRSLCSWKVNVTNHVFGRKLLFSCSSLRSRFPFTRSDWDPGKN